VATDANIVCEQGWDLDPVLYKMALTENQADFSSSESYADAFIKLFELDKNGALRIDKSKYGAVKLFAVRYAHKIKELSGLQAIVPRLNPGNRSGNKVEMFRLFISAYPAYCNMIHNLRWENKFHWKYVVKVEDEE